VPELRVQKPEGVKFMGGVEEKIERLKRILEEPLDRPFDEAHREVEELMGRPVWTHEFAFPEMLYEELRSGRRGEAFGKSLEEIAKTKPVLVLEAGKRAGEAMRR
jgi:hypothetical protein